MGHCGDQPRISSSTATCRCSGAIIGALIETSLPTIVLALQIDSMGPVQALGFVMPLVYFIFIILSTLRLDFWLSTFTGFVAAAELFWHGDALSSRVSADPRA